MSENTDALNEQYGESSFEASQDARDVEKAYGEWSFINRLSPEDEKTFDQEDMMDFAKFYAQRCGLIINEKQ
jgi:hypothetical protein